MSTQPFLFGGGPSTTMSPHEEGALEGALEGAKAILQPDCNPRQSCSLNVTHSNPAASMLATERNSQQSCSLTITQGNPAAEL